MEITIKDTAYKLKYTLRALFVFEQITGKAFKVETLTDEYIFLYSVLLANNPDVQLTFDELIAAEDEGSNIMVQFKAFLDKEVAKQSLFASNELEGKKKS